MLQIGIHQTAAWLRLRLPGPTKKSFLAIPDHQITRQAYNIPYTKTQTGILMSMYHVLYTILGSRCSSLVNASFPPSGHSVVAISEHHEAADCIGRLSWKRVKVKEDDGDLATRLSQSTEEPSREEDRLSELTSWTLPEEIMSSLDASTHQNSLPESKTVAPTAASSMAMASRISPTEKLSGKSIAQTF